MPDRDNPRIRQRIWINKLSKESQRVAKNNGRRPRITHRGDGGGDGGGGGGGGSITCSFEWLQSATEINSDVN